MAQSEIPGGAGRHSTVGGVQMIRRLAIGWIAGIVVLFTMAVLQDMDDNNYVEVTNGK